MVFARAARVVVLTMLVALLPGCGDTFRPIAIPITPPAPDPSPVHHVLFLSANGPNNPGGSTQIDVSGDSNVGAARTGVNPVHAALLPGGARIFIANGSDSTVSAYSVGDATHVSTISLGTTDLTENAEVAVPVFVATSESANVYVASGARLASGLLDPSGGTVASITTSNNLVANTTKLGFPPLALAETPDAKKVYVVGGVNGAASINTIDKTLNPPITAANLSNPVWVVASADSRHVFILNQGNGTITVVDTFVDQVVTNVPLGAAGANYMAYDKTRERLYVTNPATNTLTIVDAAAGSVLATLPMAAGVAATHVALLPDGSRAYVVGFAESASVVNWQVTIVNAQSNTVNSSKTIVGPQVVVDSINPTGCATTRFRLSTAAAADNSHVYVAHCDLGRVAIIRTSDDTLVMNTVSAPPIPLLVDAPFSAFEPVGVPPVPILQNPVFILPVQ